MEIFYEFFNKICYITERYSISALVLNSRAYSANGDYGFKLY